MPQSSHVCWQIIQWDGTLCMVGLLRVWALTSRVARKQWPESVNKRYGIPTYIRPCQLIYKLNWYILRTSLDHKTFANVIIRYHAVVCRFHLSNFNSRYPEFPIVVAVLPSSTPGTICRKRSRQLSRCQYSAGVSKLSAIFFENHTQQASKSA